MVPYNYKQTEQRTVGVSVLERNLLAHELQARCDVPAASLGVECLTAVAAQPLSERCPGVVDVVGDALGVSSTVYRLLSIWLVSERSIRTSCRSRGTCGRRRSGR